MAPESARKDIESWAACASGADNRGTYAERLFKAGFREIIINEESTLCGKGPTCMSSAEDQTWKVVSVKVEAVRPR
jgi:hypothetical protein